MRISRLVAGLVTAGLVGFVPLAASAPADAAGTVGSVATLSISNTQPAEYGDELFVSAKVTGSDGSFISTGTVSLQVLVPGATAFVTVATDDSPGFSSFDGVLASTNAVYKVVFAGGTSGSGSTATTYTASESAPTPIQVARKVNLKTSGLKVIGKVTPFAKEKVKILRKDGKKYKKFATVKTNKKGKFVFKAPSRRGFKFLVAIPADANFVAVANAYTVI